MYNYINDIFRGNITESGIKSQKRHCIIPKTIYFVAHVFLHTSCATNPRICALAHEK